jgi:hypothetical protein
MSLSSFGATLSSPAPRCASCRKYSFDEVAVRRRNQYAEPSYRFDPLLVTSDTCGPLERPMSAL